MKSLNRIILRFVVGALVFLSFPYAVFSQERIAGIIDKISGPTYWRKNTRDKEVRLDPKHDLARILRVGEQVRSGPKGLLRLTLCAGTQEISTTSGWFTISWPDVCPNQEALNAYGGGGGRTRGDRVQIFSPSDHSIVWPERFSIRWIANTAKCIISFTIKEAEDGPDIWAENNIDSSRSSLNSGKLRKRLKEYRQKVGTGPLRLRLVDSCANNQSVTFSIISTESEATLKVNLAQWNAYRGHLMFHLGRASVFERLSITPAVADEYEAALKIAPESHDLLVRTIKAHRSTGNYVREAELKKRLPPGSTAPSL